MTSATTCPVTAAAATPALAPLRGEAFSAEHLEAHFAELARTLELATENFERDRDFSARFESNAVQIAAVYQVITKAARLGEVVPAEAEWILDNYYVVEEQLREIRDDLPRGFYRELPKVTSGHPRVYELARELVIHTDSSLDESLIQRCVQQFQTVAPLTIGEVWAVPIMLRLVLIENLRRLCEQMLLTYECRHSARQLLDEWRPERNFTLEAHAEPRCIPTIIQLLEQIPERGPEHRPAIRLLERQVADFGWNLTDIIHHEHNRQAANQVSIGNVITSMRLIASLDWIAFFEHVNAAEQVLRQDPAGVYSRMHFESRDHYRHVVEELAKRTGQTDIQIAELVVKQARAATSSDVDVVRRLHVGYWLIDEGRKHLEQQIGYRPPLHRIVRHTMLQRPHAAYFGLLTVFSLIGVGCIALLCVALGISLWPTLLLAALWLFPASELAQSVTNLLVTNILPPRLLPRFDFKAGVPLQYPTIVVVPSMLSNSQEVDALLNRLESHYLANSDEALMFALLTDFNDAPQEETSKDAPLVARAVAGIRRLNARYREGGRQPFYLFHRRRQWNASEATWMGWERKRGKLMEFGRLLHGEQATSYVVQEGDLAALAKFRQAEFTPFVITLDSDTQLPHDAARKMIGTLAHPLNRPQFSANHSKVTSGYTILQPRVNVHLASAGRSWFAKIFAGTPGVDPYATAASDVYQDLFGEGSFTGKGIYDLQAFERALAGAFPENAILSHDLIEGCHARVGLVSNIEVYDGYPTRYDAEARRAHRWVRGDWQLLPWLLPYVPYAEGWKRNPLSLLSRWKVFDNLRRSLVPPALITGLLIGWYLAPRGAWLWSLAAAFVLVFPLLAQLAMIARNWSWKLKFAEQIRAVSGDVLKTVLQCVLAAAVLPSKAWSMLDAIARTLVRMFITGRRLLEWETAAAVDMRVANSRGSLLLQLWMIPATALLVAFTLPFAALLAAAPFLVLWFVAPAIAYYISQPIVIERSQCSETQAAWLRDVVSQTWAFFEAYVGDRDHWLPVDNVQEEPHEKIAHRLSPTNEGLYLLSALIARDFGLLGTHGLVQIWENNFQSLERLEKLNGHLYNWYDTETLQPLLPRYVSTVDSGNFAACLLTMQAGVHDVLTEPILRDETYRGVLDSLELLRDAYEQIGDEDPAQLRSLRQTLRRVVGDLEALLPGEPKELKSWYQTTRLLQQFAEQLPRVPDSSLSTAQGHHLNNKVRVVRSRLQSICQDVDLLFAWLPIIAESTGRSQSLQFKLGAAANSWEEIEKLLDSARTLPQIATLNQATTLSFDRLREATTDAPSLQVLEALSAAISRSSRAATELQQRLEQVSHKAEEMALAMDFRFLFNSQRRLFSIGYNVEDGRLDRSHYDMLCSEARLASYLAIAKGDVEATHWFQLGRHATIAAGKFALLSWGGTMFEYLMPQLFQRQYEGSLLTQSCQAAVLRQQEYGRQNNIPWGISESAFGALAVNADYHYRSFGVPGLGLKRGLAKDLVVSPYSTLMALTVDPAAAVANLHVLEEEGALGDWGFYDALDYTPERVPFGKRRLVVRCYMAHHQGMGLLALANVLGKNSIQRRFNAHPFARATELLLQERVPTVMTPFEPHADEVEPVAVQHEEQQLVSRRLVGVQSANPRTHILSNGKYSVMLSSAGGGFSRSQQLDVTRWRSDATLDAWGQFLYLRDLDSDQIWSATYQPTCVEPDNYEVIFAIDKVEFHRRQGEWETLLEVAVSPEHNTEVRQLRITNHSDQPRRMQVTSYAEIALAPAAADLAHPAFQKLFLETEFIPEESALLARRRPRDAQQQATYAVHVMATHTEGTSDIQFETSRQEFLGRRHSPLNPQALRAARLSGTAGAVLDPIFSLRTTIQVPAGESVTVAYSTAVAATREEALALADQHHELRNVQRVFELAWAYAQVELRHQHLSPGQVHLYQRLASYLLYPHRSLRGEEALLRSNRLGQSGLWRHGISGDLPILVARVTEPEHVALVRDLALAQRFWRERGFRTDLVIINDYPGSYLDALQDQMVSLMQELNSSAEKPGVFLLRGAHLPAEEQALFETVAACVLHGERGTLAQQLDAGNQLAMKLAAYSTPRKLETSGRQWIRPIPAPAAPEPLEYWNGTGGFAHDGREYRIRVKPDQLPPMPWSQVVANEHLGFLVTESGGGYSWFANSRENKLTSWSNDPVVDVPGEVLYLQDEATGDCWLPLSGGIHTSESWAHYGAGFARFVQHSPELRQEVMLSVDPQEPVKFVRLKITNRSSQAKTFVASYYAELVLGVTREQTHLHLQTEFDAQSQAIFCRNPYHPEYANQVAFLKVLGETIGFTTDRGEFLGRHGTWERPQGLRGKQLLGRVGVGYDPCAVVQTRITVGPQQTAEVVFLFGAGQDEAHARAILQQFHSTAIAENATNRSIAVWNDILGAIQVKTPNRAFDLLVNRWLLYQVLCCRMWARSAFYQSGGAYGFRDQLQDSMALVYSRPQLVREHLLRAAARQYKQGDVQHWWHPPLGKGTRTRFSDDLLWLPLAVSHYVRVTGDRSVLDESIPFIDSPVLQPHEQERYEQPRVSSETASLYEHCLRAIDRGLQFGPHGLPLMGCGDWNDGMNKVGEGGTGESVWVGWFLLVLLDEFAPLMRAAQDVDKLQHYTETATQLRAALEGQAWDGNWYRRAYFDDGMPLGSAENDECQIDSLAQTWAVFAKANPERSRQGVQAAVDRLVNREAKIILLFTPPFDLGELDPGYIKGYLPGIRENGGQYTHAATWMIQALAQLDEPQQAMSLFDLINPLLHTQTAADVARYQTEPYVIAADVYGVSPHQGRGGWTWYTGSGAWLYRVAIEQLLGLKITSESATLEPSVPPNWSEFEVTMQRNGSPHKLKYSRDAGAAIVNGVQHRIDDGLHQQPVAMPPAPSTQPSGLVDT
ncbi:N,N'-diacetylchitobiose phosphorylase [Anatilimnocola aggregata]|uniref:N,N'-diacetylchitobiose phosphorylase n=1 Tax=Anatilimnocola aggregata TaxID=2528021 RepID=A0A517YDN6_9BACT|nr:glucoamylase family protein [Anatilimnocola aggregata]QDU28340.1 N,N'-diacetylchitobiose phosphorylase [Anatilimnocola aggregata]